MMKFDLSNVDKSSIIYGCVITVLAIASITVMVITVKCN